MTASPSLSVGMTAPPFSLPCSDGTTVTLASLRGTRVVLYFYPKDLTTGCTQEAHEFSALSAKFSKAGVRVFGVSPDTLVSHAKFIAKEKITIPLLSDETKNMFLAYGVWKEKSMYGRKYMGVERTTVVIDEKGKIAALYPKVSVPGHAVCVLDNLASMESETPQVRG